jgi:hypothetical protein
VDIDDKLLINRCDVADCDGRMAYTGRQYGGCGEPCSYNMRKAGAGVPPFLASDSWIEELNRLVLRQSRNSWQR